MILKMNGIQIENYAGYRVLYRIKVTRFYIY